MGQKSKQAQRAGGRSDPDMFKKQTGVQDDWPRKGQFQVRSERLEGLDHGTVKIPHFQVLIKLIVG